MAAAEEIFTTLVGFKDEPGSGRTPEQALLEYCATVLGSVERLHVDFKQKRDRRHAKLDDVDKKNLGKALSGFANSGGGVLVWGIEDRTLNAKPITDVQAFLSSALALAAQITDPPVQG